MVYERKSRKYDEMRPLKITRNYLMHPEGSVLVEQGNTKVIVTASIETSVPKWMKDTNNGWITAEYDMLPRATDRRKNRDRDRHTAGRTIEIQRFIGRALRGAFELENIGEISIKVDCDTIQADGGTRCASITGGFIATLDAFNYAVENNLILKMPNFKFIGAISAGIIEGKPYLDLDYEEDSQAGVDMNFVIDEDLKFIEVQGTAERENFTVDQLMELVKLGQKAVKEIIEYQKSLYKI
ncbi:MAG: ribonuclease PH [Promethearchaeota archaeon]